MLISMMTEIESANNKYRPCAIVYIDGFNFYRRVVDKTPYKWLDLELMCTQLLPEFEIQKIKYFTARIQPTPHNPDQHLRQQVYFRALRTNPKIELHFGKFRSESKSLPVHPWKYKKDGTPWLKKVRFSQEKGSDVNLASHFVSDVLTEPVEAFIVLTNDSDQVMPMKLMQERTNKVIGLIVPESAPSKELMKLKLPVIRKVRTGILKCSLLPAEMADNKGTFTKPIDW